MRWLMLILLAWSGIVASQGGVDIAGVRFEERVRVGEAEVQLNGAGLRSVFGFRFYAIGVYLPQKLDKTGEVLAAVGPKRVQIVSLFDLNGNLVGAGLAKGIRRNLSEREFAELKERLDALRATTSAIERAPAGSVIQFDWLPAETGSGGVTRLSVNGLQRGEDIPGEDFYQALLKVWLGEKVNDARLRDVLLGRTSG